MTNTTKASDIKVTAARKLAVDAHRAGYRVTVTNGENLLTITAYNRATGEMAADATWQPTHTGGNFSRGFAVGGNIGMRFTAGTAKGRFTNRLREVREALGLFS